MCESARSRLRVHVCIRGIKTQVNGYKIHHFLYKLVVYIDRERERLRECVCVCVCVIVSVCDCVCERVCCIFGRVFVCICVHERARTCPRVSVIMHLYS